MLLLPFGYWEHELVVLDKCSKGVSKTVKA